jgi:hypothetical protein
MNTWQGNKTFLQPDLKLPVFSPGPFRGSDGKTGRLHYGSCDPVLQPLAFRYSLLQLPFRLSVFSCKQDFPGRSVIQVPVPISRRILRRVRLVFLAEAILPAEAL